MNAPMIIAQILTISFAGLMATFNFNPDDLKQVSIFIVLVAYIFWRDWQREKMMAENLKRQNEFIQSTLVKSQREIVEAIETLKTRPCMIGIDSKGKK